MKVIYTTLSKEADIKKLVQRLLEEKLIGCANWWPISSMYRWQQEVHTDKEFGVYLKTTEPKKLAKALAEYHPYAIPCIITLDVDASKDFQRWIKEASS